MEVLLDATIICGHKVDVNADQPSFSSQGQMQEQAVDLGEESGYLVGMSVTSQ
jgi:hypothetical protein